MLSEITTHKISAFLLVKFGIFSLESVDSFLGATLIVQNDCLLNSFTIGVLNIEDEIWKSVKVNIAQSEDILDQSLGSVGSVVLGVFALISDVQGVIVVILAKVRKCEILKKNLTSVKAVPKFLIPSNGGKCF